MDQELLDQLSSLGRQPAAVHGLQLGGEDLIPQPPFMDIPAEAPQLPAGDYGMRVHEPAHWTPVLGEHLDSFEALQRGEPCLAKPNKRVKGISMEKTACCVRCFLGYAAVACKLPLTLGLALCLQPWLMALFVRAKVQAGQGQQTVGKVIAQLSKVVAWWSTRPELSDRDRQNLPLLQKWLAATSKIIQNRLPAKRKCITELKEQGAWVDAEQVVRSVDAVRVSTSGRLQAVVQAGQPVTATLARLVHDVLLACMLFGYLPPLRVSCLVSLTFDGQGCADADCELAGCLGNRVQIQSGVLSLQLPHHKTVRSTGRPIVISQLPAEIEQLLTPYLALCRPLLAAQDTRTLFLTSRGRPMGLPQLSQYFRDRVLPAVGLGHVAFPPQMLRHIFVSHLMQESAAGRPGPPHAGAALAMGSSLRQWNNKYFLSRDTSLVDSAVAAMPAWRADMLQRE